jgi:hypothetical protein
VEHRLRGGVSEGEGIMPETHKFECDQCGRDLTTTGNCVDYRLALLNERLPSRGPVVTSMAIYPPIEADAYFCGVPCLAAWIAATYQDAIERYEKLQNRRAKSLAAEFQKGKK